MEHQVAFEGDVRVIVVLLLLGARPEVVVPPNGHAGRAVVRMSPALDAELLDLIERLVDIRMAYVDGRQRAHQMELPL